MKTMNKWETVNEEVNTTLQRLAIPGGWIYHFFVHKAVYASTFFVPEPDKCSYHGEYLVKACSTCLQAKPFKIKGNE